MNRNALLAIVVVLLVVGVGCGQKSVPVTGKVTMVNGDATLEVDGQSKPATVGMDVPPGSVIRTAAGAQVDVRVIENCAVRVEANGEARVAESSQNPATNHYQVAIELTKGELLNRIDGLPQGSEYQVRTPTAVCGVRGTRFGVRADAEGTEIGVLDGSVEVKFGNQTRTLSRDQIVSIYRARPATDVRQMIDRERSRLQPCGLLNFKEVIAATRAIVDVANAQTIKGDLENYYAMNGKYPESLQELYGQVKNDQFGNPYIYHKTGPTTFTLASMGEDGRPGSGDDIVIK